MNLESFGVSLRQVQSRDDRIWIEDLGAAMDDRTRVLAISHVEFATGFRNDLDALGELCRNRGVALFVDAIQGLGPHTIDVRRTPIDFLAADGHKWLLGPEGAGILYVRRDWLERLRTTGVGWHSVVGSYNSSENNFVLKPSAGRFEGGSFNMAGLLAFGASLGLFLELGPELVSSRILNRADAVREAAASAGWRVFGSSRPADRSAIVVVEKPGIDPNRAAAELRRQKVVVACRRGRLRFSPHFYNDADDIQRISAAPGFPRLVSFSFHNLPDRAMNPNSSSSYRTAVFTGTFDPISLGHLDVIQRGRLLFDHLVVGIGINVNKASLFTVLERVEMTRQVLKPFPNVTVESFEGLTVHFVTEDRGKGHPARTAHALGHGVRVRDDPDESSPRSRGRDGLPHGRRRVLARLEHAGQSRSRTLAGPRSSGNSCRRRWSRRFWRRPPAT